MKLLGNYKNGNVNVTIFNNGTKIRETEDDEFKPLFPESIDLKITNYCDLICGYCHENSTKNGTHGDILNKPFINTLQPYTEIAIGGGNPLSHPELIPFLELLKEKKIIANITINQKHIEKYPFLLNSDLVNGIGISLIDSVNLISNLKLDSKKSTSNKNIVYHIINGIVTLDDINNLINKDLKILILGYKNIRRGKKYYNNNVKKNQLLLYDILPEIINKFKIVSFDNLALEQLNIRRLVSDKQWEQFYMGDDGSHTMYVDLVKNEFAKSSTSNKRYTLKDNIIDMFNIIKI